MDISGEKQDNKTVDSDTKPVVPVKTNQASTSAKRVPRAYRITLKNSNNRNKEKQFEPSSPEKKSSEDEQSEVSASPSDSITTSPTDSTKENMEPGYAMNTIKRKSRFIKFNTDEDTVANVDAKNTVDRKQKRSSSFTRRKKLTNKKRAENKEVLDNILACIVLMEEKLAKYDTEEDEGAKGKSTKEKEPSQSPVKTNKEIPVSDQKNENGELSNRKKNRNRKKAAKRSANKDVEKTTSDDLPKDVDKAISKDLPKDVEKAISKDLPKEDVKKAKSEDLPKEDLKKAKSEGLPKDGEKAKSENLPKDGEKAKSRNFRKDSEKAKSEIFRKDSEKAESEDLPKDVENAKSEDFRKDDEKAKNEDKVENDQNKLKKSSQKRSLPRPRKPRFRHTHFLAFRVRNQNIRGKVSAIQSNILNINKDFKPGFVNIPNLHSTLGVMALNNEDEVDKAIKALDVSMNKLHDVYSKASCKFIEFDTLGSFRDQFLFMNMKSNDGLELLRSLVSILKENMSQQNASIRKDSFSPHATIIKLRNKYSLRKKGIKKIPAEMYAEQKDEYFGKENIKEILLCSLAGKKEGEFHKVLACVDLVNNKLVVSPDTKESETQSTIQEPKVKFKS